MSIRLAIRFDMRAPDLGAPAAALYPAAVELCAYADSVGFDTVYLAEHHGADDGYCASPLVLAAAIAGRTSRMRLHLSALIAVLHHPLRLAEDLATLDLVSGGRVEMTMGIGYRLHEYEMFGIEKRRRAPLLEEIIEVLTKAWTGEPFDFRGTTVMVRPRPVQEPRPPIYIGGSSEASALRAARLGDNFLPAMPGLYATYVAERQRLGLPVPPPPRPKGPLFLHVTDDPERSWHDVAPHVDLHLELQRRVGQGARRRRHALPAATRRRRPQGEPPVRGGHTTGVRRPHRSPVPGRGDHAPAADGRARPGPRLGKPRALRHAGAAGTGTFRPLGAGRDGRAADPITRLTSTCRPREGCYHPERGWRAGCSPEGSLRKVVAW